MSGERRAVVTVPIRTCPLPHEVRVEVSCDRAELTQDALEFVALCVGAALGRWFGSAGLPTGMPVVELASP